MQQSSRAQAKQRPSSTMLWQKLDGYQQNAVDVAIKAKTFGLFFEQGTGKTWIAGGIVERLVHDTSSGVAFAALFIVRLANIETTWAKFFREQLPQVRVYRSWEDYAANVTPGPRVLLLHYEAVPKHIKKLRKVLKWTLILYDESQGLKARGTLQSRTAAKLRDSAQYKIVLSGTPIDRQPQDLWGQFRFFAPDVLGTRWKDFEDTWLEPINIDMSKYRPGSFRYAQMQRVLMIRRSKRNFDMKKLPAFLKLIEPYALRVTKSVLDLPPLTMHHVPVRLRGQQASIYEEIADDMMSARVGVTAPLKVTQIGKLQQVCGGYVIDDDGEVHEVGRAKIRQLKVLVKRNTNLGPIVVFCKYLEEVRAIAEELEDDFDLRVATLTGKIKKGDRPKIIEDFQAGKIDVLVSQVKTGGVGIDLFRSCVAIFYSLTYSFIDFEQAICRLHRRGQEKEVVAYLLSAMDTIDNAIHLSIMRKRKVSDAVLTHLQRRHTWQRLSTLQHSQRNSASSRPPSASSCASMASRRMARRTAGTRRASLLS